jgi:hypothetical protein
MFVEEDEEKETRHYRQIAQQVVDAMAEFPGLEVTLVHDDFDYLTPTALIRFTKEWSGPSRSQVAAALEKGDPAIHLHQLGRPDELAVSPLNLLDDEVQIVVRRLREELLR